MAMTADAYRQQLAALRPPGLAWPADPDAIQQRLLLAWGDELARVDGRAGDLLEESDPRTTDELLSEWERAYGLPDPCQAATWSTLTPTQRRAFLLARILDAGGQRPADFVAWCAAVGVTAEVFEYWVHHVGRDLSVRLNSPDWAYTWELYLHMAPEWERDYSVADDIDLPLRTWGSTIECLARKRSPAHTNLLVSYLYPAD